MRGLSALRTELNRFGQGSTAVGAEARQRCRALLAELRAGAVVVLAAGTLHGRYQLRGGFFAMIMC